MLCPRFTWPTLPFAILLYALRTCPPPAVKKVVVAKKIAKRLGIEYSEYDAGVGGDCVVRQQ